jgi:hypothetical protein
MVAAQTQPQRFTASESVLLAAADLTAAGNSEFSEWDLTVAAWSLDRFRFGLRGYAQSYPDHKRVMSEIMGKKASSPVQLKFLEKVRPNFYKLTHAGKAAAESLRKGKEKKPASRPVTVKDLYETVSTYINRPEFRRWQDNPEEPKQWAGVMTFLGLVGKDAKVEPTDRMEEVRAAFRAALDWCTVQEAAFLTRGSGQGGTPIHVRDVADMLDFLLALTYRFPEHFEKAGEGKAKKRLPE